jgi:PAS domain S-box-containing protein
VPALRKDGARISIEFSIVILKTNEGRVAGSAAVIRDVTARWEREKALKEALKSHAAAV